MAKEKANARKVHFQDPELFFRSGGTVLKPNHITRYVYPSLCGYPKECLRLQLPVNTKKRSRPQGANSWGEDGHTFLTITKSLKSAPTEAQFTQWSAAKIEKDLQNKNPLGRAMARVTKYVGNTVLESGKFALKKGQPLVYVIRRTTMVPLGGVDAGKFGREEEEYIIDCRQWRGMEPPTVQKHEHDSWWTRLHTQSLYQASYDRAFFHARDVIDNTLKIPPPLIQWYPRPDIEAYVKLYRQPPPPDQADFLGDACFICARDWFTESEYACQLECKHFICLECLTWHVDGSGGRGNIAPEKGEVDPGTKFFRCPACKKIISITTDRADITRADELPFWRWKVMMRRMEREIKDYWLPRLNTLPLDGWHREIPEGWDQVRQINDIKVYVHYDEAVRFMDIPKKVWSTLPYGFSLDNPVGSQEALALEKSLQRELKRLSENRNRRFNTQELVEHMVAAGKKAISPVVVEDGNARLGNPSFPPGYQAYRDFLSEWTARGCFLCPTAQVELLDFMKQMEQKKDKAWWKDVRDVFFDP